MSYFKHFPFTKDYKIAGVSYDGMNIAVRTGFTQEEKNDDRNFIEYEIKEGERVEIIADRIYDDSELYWAILLFNDIFNISAEWPLEQYSLSNFIDRIYEEKKYEVHHYISVATGAHVSSTWPDYDRIPITNYEYEVAKNDDKRSIKIPVPQMIDKLKKQHKRKIQS